MRLLTDENVPDAVGEFFLQRGHELMRVRDRFGAGTSDSVIARGASGASLVVVTWNRRHFQSHVRTFAAMRAGLIAFRCNEALGRRRVEECIELIEFCHDRFMAGNMNALSIEVGETYLKILA